MSSFSKKGDLFDQLRSYFLTAGMDLTDAKIYALALKKGKLNSSDVADEFSEIQQNVAVARLKKLAKRGFLEVIPVETESKQPYVMNFKAIHPRTALKEAIEKAKELPQLLGLYDEHWDHLTENSVHDTQLWQSKSERVGRKIGASVLSGAKETIKIYSNDCSWCRFSDIHTALVNAYTKGVTTTVIAHNPEESIIKSLKENHITLYRCEGNFGPPFCVVDKNWLILPLQSSTVSKQFSMLRTNDSHLVDGFLGLFNTALSCSSKWGTKNV